MSEPTPKLGKRNKLTGEALGFASDKVIRVLNDKTMRQCFPKYGDDLLQTMRTKFVDNFEKSVPHAWQDHTKDFDFLNKLDHFDAICQEAEQRKNRGETPKCHYAIAGDGSITIPSATVPILRTATEELRQKRLALAEENDSTYKGIADMSTTANNSEAQIQKILEDFQKVLADVEAVDEKQIAELRNKMLEIVGHDL
ncbi:hypothetical protein JCM16303_004431 [Sporobolomyces ruberrimus]